MGWRKAAAGAPEAPEDEEKRIKCPKCRYCCRWVRIQVVVKYVCSASGPASSSSFIMTICWRCFCSCTWPTKQRRCGGKTEGLKQPSRGGWWVAVGEEASIQHEVAESNGFGIADLIAFTMCNYTNIHTFIMRYSETYSLYFPLYLQNVYNVSTRVNEFRSCNSVLRASDSHRSGKILFQPTASALSESESSSPRPVPVLFPP